MIRKTDFIGNFHQVHRYKITVRDYSYIYKKYYSAYGPETKIPA